MNWMLAFPLLACGLLYLIAYRLHQLVDLMKIIARKEYHEPTARLTCDKCKSELEVTKADISSDRDGDYIKCPVCDKFNGVPISLFPNKLAEAYFNK